MAKKLTIEQAAAVACGAPVTVVKAYAGTGKTTMLISYAEARPRERMLYIAFNKAIQLEAAAKFPSNVECKTTHALAYAKFGRDYQNAGKLGQLRPSDVMGAYRLDAVKAKAVLNTVESFMYSADASVTMGHVPEDVLKQHRAEVATLAVRLWADMCDLNNTATRLPHDGYLKLFQLSKPDLAARYGVILLDEEQDTNPVTADIVLSQQCRLVLVGDEHQSIYGFRRAVIASKGAKDATTLYLTHSFRFGEGVAAVATALLAGFKGETRPVVGRGVARHTRSKVDRTTPYCTISRTNASVFKNAVGFLGLKKVHFVGGVDNYPFDKLLDVFHLRQGLLGLVKDTFFKRMNTFEALEDYARKTDDKETLSLIGVVKEFGGQIPSLVARIKAEAVEKIEDADAILSTAHRSKGLEFTQVLLDSDFDALVDEFGRPRKCDTAEMTQEVNLLYVAATRATHALELNPQITEAIQALKNSGVKFPKPPTFEELAAQDALDAAMHGTSTSDTVQEKGERAELAGFGPARMAVAPAAEADDAAQIGGRPQKALMDSIDRAILREGLLTVEHLAQAVKLSRDDALDLIARMIANGRLHEARFKATSPQVVERADVMEARYAKFL